MVKFNAPVYIDNKTGRRYVKSCELTSKDLDKIKEIILENELKKLSIKK